MKTEFSTRLTDEELEYMIANKLHTSPEIGKQILTAVIDGFCKCLIENEVLHIRRFGMFFLKERKQSRFKHFDGEVKLQKSYKMVRFKPSTFLRDAMNGKLRTKNKDS